MANALINICDNLNLILTYITVLQLYVNGIELYFQKGMGYKTEHYTQVFE